MKWIERVKGVLAGLAAAVIWGAVVAWLLAFVATIDFFVNFLEGEEVS